MHLPVLSRWSKFFDFLPDWGTFHLAENIQTLKKGVHFQLLYKYRNRLRKYDLANSIVCGLVNLRILERIAAVA